MDRARLRFKPLARRVGRMLLRVVSSQRCHTVVSVLVGLLCPSPETVAILAIWKEFTVPHPRKDDGSHLGLELPFAQHRALKIMAMDQRRPVSEIVREWIAEKLDAANAIQAPPAIGPMPEIEPNREPVQPEQPAAAPAKQASPKARK